MNELAQDIINDETQPQRAVINYLLDVYKDIKGKEFDTLYERGDKQFRDHEEFFEEVILQGANSAYHLIKTMKEDTPEDYAEIN